MSWSVWGFWEGYLGSTPLGGVVALFPSSLMLNKACLGHPTPLGPIWKSIAWLSLGLPVAGNAWGPGFWGQGRHWEGKGEGSNPKGHRPAVSNGPGPGTVNGLWVWALTGKVPAWAITPTKCLGQWGPGNGAGSLLPGEEQQLTRARLWHQQQ